MEMITLLYSFSVHRCVS